MNNDAHHQIVETLLRKSASDLRIVARLVDDDEIDDEAIGFHAQQVVEKAFKALLTQLKVRYTRTHDLAFLIDLLEDNEIGIPFDRDSLEDLTPYADRFRYEDPRIAHELTRQHVLVLVQQVHLWATQKMQNKRPHTQES